MGRSYVPIRDATGSTANVRSWQNGDANSTQSQCMVEMYQTLRITKATVTTTAAALSSFLTAATALADRKKVVLYSDPANTNYVHYMHTGTTPTTSNAPPIVMGSSKELWLDASTDINLIANTASQTLWIEEWA